MRNLILSLILSYSFVSNSHGLNPNEKNDFLVFKNLLVKDHKIQPSLSIFDNTSFTGTPIINMDKDGLKINGGLVCKWSNDYAERVDSRTLRNLISGAPCSQFPPVFADDDPGGPTLLWVELTNSSNPNYFEASFQGKKVYIDKKNSSDFTLELSPEKQLRQKRSADQKVYEKTLRESASLKEYVIKMHDCFKNKKELCFVREPKEFVGAYDFFIKSVCESEGYAKPKLFGKLGKYCADLLSVEDSNSDASQSKKKKGSSARSIFNNEFWINYQSCFYNDDPYKLSGEVLSEPNSHFVNVLFHPKKEVYFACQINGRMQQDGTFSWSIFIKE